MAEEPASDSPDRDLTEPNGHRRDNTSPKPEDMMSRTGHSMARRFDACVRFVWRVVIITWGLLFALPMVAYIASESWRLLVQAHLYVWNLFQ